MTLLSAVHPPPKAAALSNRCLGATWIRRETCQPKFTHLEAGLVFTTQRPWEKQILVSRSITLIVFLPRTSISFTTHGLSQFLGELCLFAFCSNHAVLLKRTHFETFEHLALNFQFYHLQAPRLITWFLEEWGEKKKKKKKGNPGVPTVAQQVKDPALSVWQHRFSRWPSAAG